MSNVNDKFGENMFGGMRIQTEIVNGGCPTCHHSGVLVSLFKKHYRCVNCGSDLEQKVNGVIEFMPIVVKGQKVPFLQKIQSDGPKEN